MIKLILFFFLLVSNVFAFDYQSDFSTNISKSCSSGFQDVKHYFDNNIAVGINFDSVQKNVNDNSQYMVELFSKAIATKVPDYGFKTVNSNIITMNDLQSEYNKTFDVIITTSKNIVELNKLLGNNGAIILIDDFEK